MENRASKSPPEARNKAIGAFVLVLVAVCGLGSRKYAVYLPEFVAAYTGDTAWTLAVFLLLGILLPRVSAWTVAALATLVSFIVEVSQLYHAPWIDAIRETTIGHLALGSGFDPRDLACYTVGAGIGVLIDKLSIRRSTVEGAPP
jgi:glycopeptide antibiotics resistance protein